MLFPSFLRSFLCGMRAALEQTALLATPGKGISASLQLICLAANRFALKLS